MKKSKSLWKLGIAALILGGAAWWSSRSNSITPADAAGGKVFPALDASAVARMEITEGTNAVAVARQGDSWQVLSLGGYPADMNRLLNAMLRLQDLKAGHTSHGSEAPASGATEVQLEKADGSVMARLLLGEVHERDLTPEQQGYYGRASIPDGRYVATAPGKPWQLVADPLLDFSGDSMNWVEPFVLVTEGKQVVALRLSSPEQPDFELTRADGAWALPGLTPEQELDAQAVERTVGAAARVFFSGVVHGSELADEEAGFAKAEKLSLTTGTDLVYTLSFGAHNPAAQTRYLRLGAEAATGTDAAQEEAEAFNRRYGGWTYTVPAALADALTHGRTAFVKAKTPEPAKQENE